MYIEQYFNLALSLFKTTKTALNDELSLAGRSISLKTSSYEMRDLFLFSLSHLVIEKTSDAPELTIWYGEEKDFSEKLIAPPWDDFNIQGYSAKADHEDYQIFYQPWQNQFFLYCRKTKTGIYWVKSIADVPWWESTFSFRAIFHFWTYNLPAQLVHAGAIAKDENTAVLITGPSGSGKSTSCLNLLRSGYKYLGDDYVWIELSAEPTVHTLYQTAKLEPDNLEIRFNDWASYIKNKNDYKVQKAIFDITELFPSSRISSAKVKAILLPRVANLEVSIFQQISSSHALLGMAPTTLHHLPHQRKTSYKKFSELSKAIPTYQWYLGSNLDLFQSSFSEFIHELS